MTRADAESLIVEFVDDPRGPRQDSLSRGRAQLGLLSGAWHGLPSERVALDLLGGLRLRTQHPAPLKIYDVGHSECRWWTTFEAVRGLDVPDWRALTIDRREAIISPWVVYHLAAFLEDHGHDWSHITRPEHVLIQEDGTLRVAYFEAYKRGLCDSLVDQGRPATDWHDMLAPELFKTKDRTETMMVYALGVLLTYLATGRRPLRQRSAKTTVLEAMERKVPMSSLVPLPPRLAEVIDLATHPSDKERILTLRDLELELEPHLPKASQVSEAVSALMPLRRALQDPRLRFCV